MSKATLKISSNEGQQLVCVDVLLLLNLIEYQGRKVHRSLVNVDYENCDYELEVITHNGAEELKRVFELDAPVFDDE